MNRKNFIIVGIFLYSTVFIAVWLIYSLLRFSGFYSPIYVFGLLDPFSYYQKNIGLQLIEHGIEYKMSVAQDESKLKTYIDDEYNFEFKYPNNWSVVATNESFDSKISENIKFSKVDDSNSSCNVVVTHGGRGVGANWLPRSRKILESRMSNNEEPLYFNAKNNQTAYIHSTIIPSENISATSKFVQVLFISKEGRFLDASIKQMDCLDDFGKDIFTTFQFIR